MANLHAPDTASLAHSTGQARARTRTHLRHCPALGPQACPQRPQSQMEPGSGRTPFFPLGPAHTTEAHEALSLSPDRPMAVVVGGGSGGGGGGVRAHVSVNAAQVRSLLHRQCSLVQPLSNCQPVHEPEHAPEGSCMELSSRSQKGRRFSTSRCRRNSCALGGGWKLWAMCAVISKSICGPPLLDTP